MKYILILICTFFLSTIIKSKRQLQSTYSITATRSKYLAVHCANTNKQNIYSKYGLSTKIKYQEDFKTFFNVDETLIDDAINFKFWDANNKLKSNPGGYALYILPGAIGVGLIIVMAPILAVWLFCPMSCCQRKKLQYTECQKKWPAYIILILCIAIIGCCIAGVSSNFKMSTGYQQLSCSGITIFDDALYGAVSLNNDYFFSGISTINDNLKTLTSNNLNNIYGNFTKLSSQPGQSNSQTINKLNSAAIDISIIPNVNQSNLSLSYKTPFNLASPTGTIDSTLIPILGSKNYRNTLIGQATASVNEVNTNFSKIISSIDSFINSSSTFSITINQMINQTLNSKNQLLDSIITINDIFVSSKYTDRLSIIEPIFYGVVAAFTFLLFIAVLMFSFCDNLCCNTILKLLGFFFFLIALVSFALLLILSFLSPLLYSGCRYLKNSFEDTQTFTTNLKKLGVTTTVANQYSVCLLGQSGDIISKISGQQNKAHLDLLKHAMNNATFFDGAHYSNTINKTYSTIPPIINNYGNILLLDINDNSSIQILNKISDHQNYNCSNGDFRLDSWIPNIKQIDNYVTCKAPGGSLNVDNTTCTMPNQFRNAQRGCIGCMSTFSLLYNFNSSTEVNSYLQSRYQDCLTFNTQLSNIWINYYLIRRNSMKLMVERQALAKSDVQAVTTAFNTTLPPLFNTTINNLLATSRSILTPNYGMLWGLDCRIFGQDLNLLYQTSCHGTFSYVYYHRILLLIVSFSLLFLLCCNTCVISRRRKDIYLAQNGNEQGRARPMVHHPESDDRIYSNNL